MANRRLPSADLKNLRGPEFRRLLQDLKSGAFDSSPTFESVTVDNVTIDGNTIAVSGALSIDGLIWPTADGTVGQVLQTDGAGNLSFSSGSGFDLTSYALDTVVGATDLLLINDGDHKKITRQNLEASLLHDSLDGYVANEHIDWTSGSVNFSTSGTVATGQLTTTGDIIVTGTVDGRDVAADGTKLDGIEALAEVTSEAKVVAALDNASLSTVTSESSDRIIIQDVSDSNNIKIVTVADVASGGSDTFTAIEVDGVSVSTAAATLDFDGTDFTLTETPTDDFDIIINEERIQDIAGAMVTGNTETGISVTYEDGDGTLDFVVSDLTVAGDTGSTGMTPGDTLTIEGDDYLSTAMSGDTLSVTQKARPSFSAYLSANQSVNSGAWTKIQFNTEAFDIESDYDNATNYRHTPSVTGKYLYTVHGHLSSLANGTTFYLAFYKNGTIVTRNRTFNPDVNITLPALTTCFLADMNGTTDYVEVFIFHSNGSATNFVGGSTNARLNGVLVDV